VLPCSCYLFFTAVFFGGEGLTAAGGDAFVVLPFERAGFFFAETFPARAGVCFVDLAVVAFFTEAGLGAGRATSSNVSWVLASLAFEEGRFSPGVLAMPFAEAFFAGGTVFFAGTGVFFLEIVFAVFGVSIFFSKVLPFTVRDDFAAGVVFGAGLVFTGGMVFSVGVFATVLTGLPLAAVFSCMVF